MRYDNEEIRYTAKDLVVAYTQHVKKEIEAGNPLYLESSVDEDVNVYEGLYKVVLGEVLGVKPSKTLRKQYSKALIEDIKKVVKEEVRVRNKEHIISEHPYSAIVYEVCLFVFAKFKQECCDVH